MPTLTTQHVFVKKFVGTAAYRAAWSAASVVRAQQQDPKVETEAGSRKLWQNVIADPIKKIFNLLLLLPLSIVPGSTIIVATIVAAVTCGLTTSHMPNTTLQSFLPLPSPPLPSYSCKSMLCLGMTGI